MYGQKIIFVFILLIISIVAQQHERKKTCIHNLVVNGTNLITANRKQLLVIGITNFNNISSRIQAHRYNDLYRELERDDIRDSIVRFILINENDAAENFPGDSFGSVRVYQDNSRDRIIKKLRTNRQTLNNLVFGRCGYLIFSQEGSHTDLDDGKNYKELYRTISTAVKNKRRCQGICS